MACRGKNAGQRSPRSRLLPLPSLNGGYGKPGDGPLCELGLFRAATPPSAPSQFVRQHPGLWFPSQTASRATKSRIETRSEKAQSINSDDLWPRSDQAAEQRARPCADFGAGSQPVIFLTCMTARAHLSTAPPQNDRWNICIPTGQCQSYPPRHSGVIVEGQKLVRLRIDKTVPFGFPVVSFPDPRVLTKPRSDASAHSSNHTCTPPIHNARATPDGHHLRPSVHQISEHALNHRLSEREPYLRWATGDGMAAVRIVA